ncbi:hypothetical protein DFH09DRAFT_1314524 [Mycena vulgaris]|nr:hypothetical protein DFH09DRAFT_1314524 [Mycena vulgaris]
MNIEVNLTVIGAQRVDSHLPHTLKFHLHRLQQKFWNVKLPTNNVWDMETKIPGAFNWTDGKLLLLEQYPKVLDRLRKQREDKNRFRPNGILITGSPGIGKTSSLCVAVLESEVFKGVLYLVDMEMKDSELRLRVLSKSCQAASPPVVTDTMTGSNNAILGLVLNSPKKTDFYSLAKLTGVENLVKFETRLDGLLDVFGPNIRDLLPAINELDDDALQTSVDKHIGRISGQLEALGADSLKCLFTSPDNIASAFSHTLIHTYGVDSGIAFRDDIQHRIRSPLILRLMLQLLQRDRLSNLREMYDILDVDESDDSMSDDNVILYQNLVDFENDPLRKERNLAADFTV